MKFSSIRFSFLLFIFFLTSVVLSGQGLPTASPEEVGLSSERLDKLTDLIQGYVDDDTLPGAVVLVARKGRAVYFESFGETNLETGQAMPKDALFRIMSMTKAVTSVAVMMLYEEGHFLLDEKISKYIPEFENPQVIVQDDDGDPFTYETVPARNEITIRHLLTHTSGITYRFFQEEPFATLYAEAGVSDGIESQKGTVGEAMRRLGRLPLRNHPGEAWAYGLSTDVLGYLVELVSGKKLDEFVRERIFQPLEMEDTYFYLPEEKMNRLATIYTPGESGGGLVKLSTVENRVEGGTYFSGGGGLISSAPDYLRFTQMLLNGGELEGARILGRKTVELMTTNQIGDLPLYWDFLKGHRWGLGFALHQGSAYSGRIGSVGEFRWAGYYHTFFWVDPEEEVIGILMSQVFPNLHLDVYSKFRVLTYQSIVD